MLRTRGKMRIFKLLPASLMLCVGLGFLNFSTTNVSADNVSAAAETETKSSERETIDDLYARLKNEANPASAALIASQIRQHLRRSPNKTIELLMSWQSIAYEKRRDFGTALDLLDQITVLDPEYPEGWNQRATLYYEQDKLALALKDIERTLALEPRHFDALTGMASILERIGYPRRAEQVLKTVLEIYPASRIAQSAYIRLVEENTAIQH